MKDFSLYDEKCGTCLTIGYIASAAVAAILVSLLGGSVITQLVLFVFAAAVLGYGANRYCMGRMAAEEKAAPAPPPAQARPAEKAPEPVKPAAPAAEKAAEPAKKAAPAAEKAAEPAKKAAPAAKKPAPPADDRSAALAAAKAAAAKEAEAKAAMAKAVAALESKKAD